MEGVLRLLKLSLQPGDGCLEALGNLLGLLGLIRRFSFCLLDCQLQLGYLLCQAISVGFEIVYFRSRPSRTSSFFSATRFVNRGSRC